MTSQYCPCCKKKKDIRKYFKKDRYCCDACEKETENENGDDQGWEDYY